MNAPGPPFQRPTFVVAAPLSGAPALLEALAKAPGTVALGQSESPFDDIPALAPANREWQDNRLTGADTVGDTVGIIRERLVAAVEGRAAGSPAAPRLLHASPKDGLRIPFLNSLFPDATFIYLYREPRETLAEMLRAWDSGRFVSYGDLPGWEGPPWSLPLVPGWRDLIGRDLPEIVAQQWIRTTRILLGDLQTLPPARWCVAEHTALREHPRAEIERLGEFCELAFDGSLDAAAAALEKSISPAAPPPVTTEQRDRLEDLLPSTDELARAARAFVAVPLAARRAQDPGESPLRSVYTSSFPQVLRQMASSLLVSTYQTGKLVCLRETEGTLNTHFRNFEKPMGLAVLGDRIAIGSRLEVWDYRDIPDAAPKVEPAGTHDACFVPRNRHYTADISIHEVAWAAGQLWIIATAFSCLATLDNEHSFVPRWTPPFISELAPGDRCHLNGLCVVDDQPRYVTALGQTDEAGTWRQNKAAGGCLIDVQANEVVIEGLSMPHSPRWHRDSLWVLESGKGELCRADPAAGTVETVVELPGFTRGLAFAGNVAFVGLSQIRETATFGGLPLTERLEERLSGVWMVDIDAGEIAGFIRFEDLVQEVFDVAILPGKRYPEIAEERSPTTAQSYVLPPGPAVNIVDDLLERYPASKLALVALDAEGGRRDWHFGELIARSAGLSGAFAARGVRRGDVVMTLIGNRVEWVLTLLACWRMGAVALPCNTQLRRADLKLRAAAAGPRLCVGDEGLLGELPDGIAAMTLAEVEAVMDEDMPQETPVEPAAMAPDDPALIVFTSGTTGEPRGAVHGYRYIDGQRLQAEHWFGARPGDLAWCTTSTGWSKSARNVFLAPWLMGAAATIHDARFDPAERLDLIEELGVNVLCQAPTEYRMLAKRTALRPLPALRRMVSAGEPLNPEIVDEFRRTTGHEVADGYGQTETGHIAGVRPGEAVRPGSMGRPLPGLETRITDGELQLRVPSSPTFFTSYLGSQPFEGEWWATGDLVRADEDGWLFFEGRNDDIILSAGYRIGPFEVESALVSHPAVAEAAAVAAPDPERGSVVRAVVVLREGTGSAELAGELQEHCKRATAPYKFPRIVEFTDALPKTASGKIKRAELRGSV